MMSSFLETRRRAPGFSIWRILVFWTIVILLMRLSVVLLYRFKRRGMGHVPRTGPIIFVANHQSNFDPALVGMLVCDRPFLGIARVGLFSSRLLSIFLHQFGAIELKRGESDIKAIRSAIMELNAGRCVLIFPEGTRSPDGDIHEFKRGFWLLLKKSKAIILPVGIEGAYDAWKIGTKPKLRGYIEVAAGPPIEASQLLALGEEEGTSFVRSTIEELCQQCRIRIDLRSK